MQSGNIFSDIPQGIDQERFEGILSSGSLRIERIISGGWSTPLGQWYDQEQDEWVILLAGSATLMIEGLSEAISLRPGDPKSGQCVLQYLSHRGSEGLRLRARLTK